MVVIQSSQHYRPPIRAAEGNGTIFDSISSDRSESHRVSTAIACEPWRTTAKFPWSDVERQHIHSSTLTAYAADSKISRFIPDSKARTAWDALGNGVSHKSATTSEAGSI